jgi:tetratricopeptide (TPR) repeat protein
LGTEEPPPAAASKLRLTLSSIEFMNAREQASLALADQVLAEPGLDEDLYAAAELLSLMALMSSGNFEAARGPAEAILAGNGRLAGDASFAGALTVLGSIAWGESRVLQAIGFFRAAVRRAEHGTEVWRRVHPRQSLAVVLAATGEFEEAEDLLRQDRREIDVFGDGAWSYPGGLSPPDPWADRRRPSRG